MNKAELTRVIYSPRADKFYLQFNNLLEVHISKDAAREIIQLYNFEQINETRWEPIKQA